MKVLVRKYTKNGDKSNKLLDTIDEGLKALGKRDLSHTKCIVPWLNYVDIFFEGTENYLRIVN